MKARILSMLGRAMASSPRILLAIERRGALTPYEDIIGPDGRLYMRRWWLLPRWCLKADGRGVLMPRAWMPFSIRLHHIVLPDSDRHLHDHPFDFRTFVLRGWYVEEDVFDIGRVLAAGRTESRRAQDFHRIEAVSPGGVLTLFVMGRRINAWGFLVDGHKVGYREYLSGGA